MVMSQQFAAVGLVFRLLLGLMLTYWSHDSFGQRAALGCVVAEFKALSLNVHDPVRKTDLLKKWLMAEGEKCNRIQAQILLSNSPSWLGAALSVEIAGMVEGIYESKVSGDESRMAELYLSKGKGFKPGVEVTKNPEPRDPIVQSPISPVIVGDVTNINVPLPVASAPVAEPPRRTLRFTPKQIAVVRKFFDDLRGNKECPPFMKPAGAVCKSVRDFNKPYKLDEAFQSSPFINELPEALKVLMQPPPRGHKYLQANEDIILVNQETNMVVDAIIDFGGVPVIAEQAANPVPNSPRQPGPGSPRPVRPSN